MMKFLTGLSASAWLHIGAGLVIAGLIVALNIQGSALTSEREAHAVTRASVIVLRGEIAQQNAAIEAQRVAHDQAKRDLAAAVAASQGDQAIIADLATSARSTPAGAPCAPSATARRIWK